MSNSYILKIAKYLLSVDKKTEDCFASCKYCKNYDLLTQQCCHPSSSNCESVLTETLQSVASVQTNRTKQTVRNYQVGDVVMGDGVGTIVYVSEHHKNDDPNEITVKQYVVQYKNGKLEIRTNASLSLITAIEKHAKPEIAKSKYVYVLVHHDFCNQDFYIMGVYSSYDSAVKAYDWYEEGMDGTPLQENDEFSIVEIEYNSLVTPQRGAKAIDEHCGTERS